MVSVIVTTYNRKALLKETIDSILCQTYTDYELIVVDNYSDYDFIGFVKSFESDKIRAFQNHNNGIIAVNRNFGIEKAKGEYIAFCDDDDLWMPDKLEKQMNYMQSHDVDLISTSLFFFDDNHVSAPIYRPYKKKLDVYLKSNITPSTVLVRNTPEVRFSEESSINCAEDWELFAKLITIGYKYYQMPEALVKYRFLANTTNKSKVQPHLRTIKMLKVLKKECGANFNIWHYCFAVLYHTCYFTAHRLGLVKFIKRSRIK